MALAHNIQFFHNERLIGKLFEDNFFESLSSLIYPRLGCKRSRTCVRIDFCRGLSKSYRKLFQDDSSSIIFLPLIFLTGIHAIKSPYLNSIPVYRSTYLHLIVPKSNLCRLIMAKSARHDEMSLDDLNQITIRSEGLGLKDAALSTK